MEQKDKDLLLKDLCARLPYKTKIQLTEYSDLTGEKLPNKIKILDYCMLGRVQAYCKGFRKDEIKPYLFPLSSMTDEQCYELSSIRSGFQDCWKYIKTPIPLSICNFEQIDWFHKNHFDYRGLIEKSLAIDATNLNIY